MDSEWILGMVNGRSLRRVVAWVVVVAAVVLLVNGQRRYFRNFFGGPYVLGAAELGAIGDVAQTPRYFVKVTGSQVEESGIQEITVRKRHGFETGRSVSNYYVLTVGDRFLVCKSGSSASTTFQGELEPMPADLAAQLSHELGAEVIHDHSYPYYLNDD